MGLNKSTFKHAAIYSAAAMLGKIIGFMMLPFYAHILGDLGYGVIGMVDVSLSFLMSLLAHGVLGALARFYHEEEGADKNLVISTGIWLTIAAALALAAVGAALSKPICHLLLGDSSYWFLLCLGLGAFAFDLVGNAAGVYLVIKRRSIPFSVVGLLRLFIGLSLNIYLLLYLKLELRGYFIASLLTAVVPAIIFVTNAYRNCGAGFNPRIARKIIAFQTPLIPGALASFASRQVERILIRFLISIETVGVLEMGYKFPVLLNMLITYPFLQSWDTKRIEIAQSSDPEAPRQIGRMFTYNMFLLIMVGLVMASGIKDVLQILTPSEFWAAYRIAQIEILTLIFFGATFHVNFGLFFHKDTKTWAHITIVTSVLKIAMSFFFISLLGFEGAVYSACITGLIRLLWSGWRGQKLYPITIEYGKLLAMLGVAVTVFVVLSRTDVSSYSAVAWLATEELPRWLHHLDGTFLATWKDGKALLLLNERTDLFVSLGVRVAVCLVFVVFFPFVKGDNSHRLARWLTFRGNKS